MLYADFFYYYARSKWYGGKLRPQLVGWKGVTFWCFLVIVIVGGIFRSLQRSWWFHSTRGVSKVGASCGHMSRLRRVRGQWSMQPIRRIQSLAVWLFRYDKDAPKIPKSQKTPKIAMGFRSTKRGQVGKCQREFLKRQVQWDLNSPRVNAPEGCRDRMAGAPSTLWIPCLKTCCENILALDTAIE